MSLIESLQQHLNYPPLKKVDPNTQEVTHDETETPEQMFGQAAIPSVLTGLRHLAASDEGATNILNSTGKQDWIPELFPENGIEVTHKVAAYSGYTPEVTYEKMNEIADVAAGKVREEAGEDCTALNIKQLLENQIENILLYLPASLQLGKIFNNNTLDDRTHKMEGPVSGMMKAISSAFNNADEDEKKKN